MPASLAPLLPEKQGAAVREPLAAANNISINMGGRMALENVSLEIHAGEIITVIGPNGAGKTTLIRSIAGLLSPESGEIIRSKGLITGYMPQNPTLDPALPMTVQRFLTLWPGSRSQDAEDALDMLECHSLRKRQVHSISGGERQRVMLARALAAKPSLLILDEPLSAIDVSGQAEIYRLLAHLRDEWGLGILLVSHDLHLVMANTDRVICLNGSIRCQGTPEELVRHPEFAGMFGRDASAFAIYRHSGESGAEACHCPDSGCSCPSTAFSSSAASDPHSHSSTKAKD